MKGSLVFISLVAILAIGYCVAQQAPAAGTPAPQVAGRSAGRGGFGGPIELGPDDKPAFADPPAGFNVKRDNIPHGELTPVEYDSKSRGTHRRMRVYTPPGYSAAHKYPVLYLLHGVGGTDTEWTAMCHANTVIDNLLAEGKVEPMVMVFPDGNSSRTVADLEAAAAAQAARAASVQASEGRGTAPVEAPRPGAGRGRGINMEAWLTPFENDLLQDIIPTSSWLESREISYVIGVTSQYQVFHEGARRWVSEIEEMLPQKAWKSRSAGAGTKGERISDWALLPLGEVREGRRRWILFRRRKSETVESSYYVVSASEKTTLDEIVKVAGSRWAIEESFESAKGEVGLDHYEVRNWDGWYRHITLAMFAHAYLTVVRARAEAPVDPSNEKKKLRTQRKRKHSFR